MGVSIDIDTLCAHYRRLAARVDDVVGYAEDGADGAGVIGAQDAAAPVRESGFFVRPQAHGGAGDVVAVAQQEGGGHG